MKRFNDQEIEGYIRDNEHVFQDLEFNRCTFFCARIRADLEDPSRRPVIRNARLNDCTLYNADATGAILEDIEIHNLKTRRTGIFLRGNAYRHVKLVGKIPSICIRGKVGVLERHEIHNEKWDAANFEYYRDVDWALDITEAKFSSMEIKGVPTRLIRRDPEITAVVTREAALEGKWKKLAYGYPAFNMSIWALLEQGYEDTLLIAGRASKNFKDAIEDLEMLRAEGVAT